MHLGVFLLEFILYVTLCASWTWLTISFSMLGKFSTIISSKIFSYPFFFSSSSGTPITQMLMRLILSQTSLRLSSVLFILFTLFCSGNYFQHFIFQLIDSLFCFRYSAIDSFYRKEKERVWEIFWRYYSWKFPQHGKWNSQSSPRGTKSPIQDKPKEKHAKTHTNHTNKG